MTQSTRPDKVGTTSFYAPPEQIQGTTVVLPPDEARHAARVLRLGPGDEIDVVDGEGGWYRVRLHTADKQRVAGDIIERRRLVGEAEVTLDVGLALLKQPGRYETFLEKAAEIGVTGIIPLVTAHTEKQKFNPRRLHNLSIAAMKQCGRSRRVELSDPRPLKEVLTDDRYELKLICHEETSTDRSLLGTVQRHRGAGRVLVLVGPEGGFSREEVEAARDAGYIPVSLGARRLRAETAAIVAAALVMAAFEQPLGGA
jgi:16S rRNA (uracil1498-N3)-methyltransferase